MKRFVAYLDIALFVLAMTLASLVIFTGCNGVDGSIGIKMRPHKPGQPDKPPDGYRVCDACGGDGIYETPRGYKGRCFACNGSGLIAIPPPRPAPKPVWPRPRRTADHRDDVIGSPNEIP